MDGRKATVGETFNSNVSRAHLLCRALYWGGALFFIKQPSKAEVINDINGELVNLYRVTKHHLDEFIRHFRWTLISRKEYEDYLKTPPDLLTDIQRAERFYYLQKLAFGGKSRDQSYGTTTTTKPKLNLLRLEEELSDAHIRLSNAQIEHLSWDACVHRYDRPHTFFYFDPPYLGTAQYAHEFSEHEYLKLAETMGAMQGKALLSINDHPSIREIFADFEITELATQYTLSRKKTGNVSAELAIKNY